MSGDETPTTPEPEAPDAKLDPAGLKDALGRTGRMLKTAGLPFEEDEFDADDDSTSESSDGESSDGESSDGESSEGESSSSEDSSSSSSAAEEE